MAPEVPASKLAKVILALVLAVGLHTPDLSCRVRNSAGEIVRSSTRRALFLRMTGFPKGRPGYAADHVVPLACGGCDVPSNMVWLTVEEWKAKTSWERNVCTPEGWRGATAWGPTR